MKKILYILIGLSIIAGGIYKFVYLKKTKYETITIKKGDLYKEAFAVGTVDAQRIYKIAFSATGKVLSVEVDEGAQVKKGQLLAKMDPIDLEAKLKEAEAAIKKAIIFKKIAENKIIEAEAQYDLAILMLNRYQELFKNGFVSQVELDKATLAEISAKSTLNSAKVEKLSTNSEIDRLQYVLEGLKKRLRNLSLRTEHDGIIAFKDVEAGDTIAGGKIIFKIINPEDVWIKAFIDERLSGDIKLNQKAKIRLRSKENLELGGYVKKIDLISDAVTEEREIDIAFDKVPMPFFINEQAEVKINLKTYKNVLQAPSNLIVNIDGVDGIWVIKDSHMYFKKIRIIDKSATSGMAAIEGDIKVGDRVIVTEKRKKPLKDGAKTN